MNVQSMEKMGKDFSPNFLRPRFEKFDGRSCDDGSREFVPIFHNSHRKGQPFQSTMARTLEYLVGVPSRATSSGREENKFNSTSVRPVNIFNAEISQSEVIVAARNEGPAAAVSTRRAGGGCR